MALAAELRTERPETENLESRAASRRKLYLGARASAGPKDTEVLIHNLSSTGMLLETSADLVGKDEIEVHIPEAGTVRAAVIWHSDSFYGCEFEQPLSRAAVSAALLRSPAENAQSVPMPAPSPLSTLEAAYSAVTVKQRDPNALSLRAKFAIITGLAVLSWIPIVAIAWLIF